MALETEKKKRKDDLKVKSWDENDVGAWLEALELWEHSKKFQEAHITGPKLIKLTRPKLMALGVTKMGHLVRIEMGLKRLQQDCLSPRPTR